MKNTNKPTCDVSKPKKVFLTEYQDGLIAEVFSSRALKLKKNFGKKFWAFNSTRSYWVNNIVDDVNRIDLISTINSCEVFVRGDKVDKRKTKYKSLIEGIRNGFQVKVLEYDDEFSCEFGTVINDLESFELGDCRVMPDKTWRRAGYECEISPWNNTELVQIKRRKNPGKALTVTEMTDLVKTSINEQDK